MKKIVLFFLSFFFMGLLFVSAQTKTVTGKVTSSEDKTPIPGVSVVVKGTTLGTVTNIEGIYELRIP
jgi:hypothetical protein